AVASAAQRAAWSAARPLIGASGGQAGGRELSRTFKCFDHAVTDGVEGVVTITGGKATTLRAMAEATPTWSAPSSASRQPAAPLRSSWHPTPPTTPGGRHEQPTNRAPRGLPPRPGRRRPPLRPVPGAGQAPHHRARRPPGRPPPPGPQPCHPSLLPAWLLRHLRDAGQRPRGPGLRDPTGRPGRPGGGRAPGRGRGGRRPGRGHGACLPAARVGRPAPGPGQRTRRGEGREGGYGSRAGGPGTLRGLHRVRPVLVGVPGRRGSPLPGSGCLGRRRAGPGGTTRRLPEGGARAGRRRPGGRALPYGVRMLGRLPGRGRPRRGDHAAAWSPASGPAAPADRPVPPGGPGIAQASRHDGNRQRRRPRWLDPRGRHLGTWAFVANRLTGLGLVAYLYLHLVLLSTLLRGPEAWDGLVELFRRPVFLAFDLLLVAGLAFHGLNGLRVALVGSGLLVDRHRAPLVAAAILVGLVTRVAAVRILA